MSAEAVSTLDKHISTNTILSRLKRPALVLSLSGKIARINSRCGELMPNLQEGRMLTETCEEKGVFGSMEKMIKHARSVSGLHPCRLVNKVRPKQSSLLGYFSILCSQITHQSIAVLLQVDERKSERQNSLVALDSNVYKQRLVLRQSHQDRMHDPLTGLKNRDYMERFLKVECGLNNRRFAGGTLVVIDIDHFKRVNDFYGHDAGDRVLKEVADTLKERLRDSDIACRRGGEEFVLYLHSTNGHRAFSTCEELRTLIQHHEVKYQAISLNVTASFGITSLNAEDTHEAVFARADEALYQAKSMGRNQVQVVF